MAKAFLFIPLAASIGTAPVLILLILLDLIMERFSPPISAGLAPLGFMGAPFLFPLVLIGTIASCRRSIAIRQRPLAIALGLLGVTMTGLITAYWCYILTHGFMG